MQKIYVAVLLGIVIVLVGVSAYLFGQNKASQKHSAAKTEELVSTPSTFIENEKKTDVISSPFPTPVVIFEAQASIPPQDLIELKNRVVNPYIDYKAETQPGELVSFKISPNLLASKSEYPYMADAVFKNGGNEGFLISKGETGINWYIPGCMNGCQFSEGFQQKYPEIVKLSQ